MSPRDTVSKGFRFWRWRPPTLARSYASKRRRPALARANAERPLVEAEHHRRELHVHCYRMLASFDEAEDAVQETFLHAWRGRDSYDGRSLFRAWLYCIATNVCLDALRRRSRRPATIHSFAEVPWLQPYPDRLLDVDCVAATPA